jgi:hypothetical protein
MTKLSRIDFPKGAEGFSAAGNGTVHTELSRRRAQLYIHNAAAILSGIGEDEKRLSWILEDCAGLLTKPRKKKNQSHENLPNPG